MITNQQLCGFMNALAANVRGKNGLILSDWENDFLTSYLILACPQWFTPGRRASAEKLWMRYGGEINQPHPLDAAGPVNRTSDEASPDGCEFWMKDEGRQRRCNEPAELVGRRGLRYCRMHADEVIKNMRREGRSIELRPFKGKS